MTARASLSTARRMAKLPPGVRSGFVLAAALVALMLIALLITGAFFASGQEITVARNELRDQQAFAYAEYALAHALESWDAAAADAMTAGQTVSFAPAPRNRLESAVFITRLDTALFLVVAESRVRAADALGVRHRIGIVVRTVRDGAPVNPPVRVTEQAWVEMY